MYRWVDDEGGVTYSNTPPPDPSAVKGLTRIEDPAPATVPADKPANAGAPVTLRDMQTPRESTMVKPGPAAQPHETGVVQREAESAPPVTRGVQADAVRDPCLRSSDPKCHERNKDHYHPYLGYAPGAQSTPAQVQSPAAPAVGASSGPAGGGTVGGALRR